MTNADDPADDDLLHELRATVHAMDPVPRSVVDFARAAPSVLSLDMALAELIEEAALTSVRDSAAGRRLTFAVGDDTVTLNIVLNSVFGEFSAAGWQVDVVFARDGIRQRLVLDEGDFEFAVPQHPFVLVFTRGDESVATHWITD